MAAPFSLTLGEVRIDLIRDGTFRLDGGAMFGVVPRALWAPLKPPDDRNRIHLAANCLLVRGLEKTVLIESGIGDKWSEKHLDMFGIDPTPGVPAELERLGLSVKDIELCLLTHLHFDHAGGNTRKLEDGTLVPRLPNARFAVQRGNLEEEALVPHPLRRASYLAENIQPLIERDLFSLLEGDSEVMPGLSVRVTGGHQRHHQVVFLRAGGQTVLFTADLIPTAAHLQPTFIMAYDHYPLETLAVKQELLPRAAEEGWILVLGHETDAPVGRVEREGRRYRWVPSTSA
jgi:glyoxylase-like metal-dependent hydrolase (beta-lactamase superfamily II)